MRKYILIIILSITSLCQASDVIRVYWAENFEGYTTASMAQDSLVKNWHAFVSSYGSNGITTLAGSKYWISYYRTGHYAGGNDDGHALNVPIGAQLTQCYYTWDLIIDPNFQPLNQYGYASIKMLDGFTMGYEVMESNGTGMDSSAWGVGSSSNGLGHQGYDLNPYYYDQIHPGPVNQFWTNPIMYFDGGNKHNITVRIVLNTDGKPNGIYEIYYDHVLVGQRTNVLWRSFAQQQEGNNLISATHITYFFGGSGYKYESPRDNWIAKDNIVIYDYAPGSDHYLAGAAPAGYVLPAVTAANKKAPDPYVDSTYTHSSGRIFSQRFIRNGPPRMLGNDTYKTQHINVPNATYIDIKVRKIDVGYKEVTVPYVKIYEGSSLKYTWLKSDESAIIGQTFRISGNTARLDYRLGEYGAGGFAFDYTSDGDDPQPPVDTFDVSNKDTILINFNYAGEVLPNTAQYNRWNNINDYAQNRVWSLKNTKGTSSGIRMKHLSSGIYGISNGISGLAWPDLITTYGWRTSDHNALGQVRFDHLYKDSLYTLTVFSTSFVSLDSTLFTLDGITKSIYHYNNRTQTQSWTFTPTDTTINLSWKDKTGYFGVINLIELYEKTVQVVGPNPDTVQSFNRIRIDLNVDTATTKIDGWNRLAPVKNHSYRLINLNNDVTPVSLKLVSDNVFGEYHGYSPGIYNSRIMKGLWRADGTTGTIRLKGMNVDTTYIITLYASNSTDNIAGHFNNYFISDTMKTMPVYNNSDVVITWTIKPIKDSLDIGWNGGNSYYGNLNAIIIQEVDNYTPTIPTNTIRINAPRIGPGRVPVLPKINGVYYQPVNAVIVN